MKDRASNANVPGSGMLAGLASAVVFPVSLVASDFRSQWQVRETGLARKWTNKRGQTRLKA
jgi:hypothetical protein